MLVNKVGGVAMGVAAGRFLITSGWVLEYGGG